MQENEVLISVPSHIKIGDVVHYQLIFSSQSQGLLFSNEYRYSQLKKLYESLQTLKCNLPKFPETHWWIATNNNEELILQRRQQLDNFFQSLNLSQTVKKSLIMKNFILEAQSIQDKKIKKQHANINKEKSNSQFTTPVCKPQEEPRLETGELRLRTRHRSFSHTGYKQLQNVNVGGTNIFKGILTRAK